MSILRSGSSGPEVEQLQRDLVTLGQNLEVTGVYDAATVAAVQRVQHAAYAGTTHPVDGVYSLQTAAFVTAQVKTAQRLEGLKKTRASLDAQAKKEEPAEAPAPAEPEAAPAPAPAPETPKDDVSVTPHVAHADPVQH